MDREICADGVIRTQSNFCKKAFSPYSANFSSDKNIDDPSTSGASTACKSNVPFGNRNVVLNNVRKALCKFVVSGEHPFSIIEEPAFKEMMCALCPDFDTITMQTLFRDALKYHKEERIIVESDLISAPGRICIALENLRKNKTGGEYVCVTACWIDHNWGLQKRMIRLLPSTPTLDGVALAEEILLKLSKWKTEKVISFILDDASYSDSLVASLRSHLQRKQAFGELFHVRSYSHIISLLGHSSLNLIDDILPKIRNIVMHLRHYISKQKKFYEDAQMSFGLETTERLCTDTCNLWDSTFLMLDVFLHYRNVVDNFVSSDMDTKVYCLTEDEWAKVDEIHKFLKVIYELSTSKKPDSNIYFYMVWKIQRKLLEISNCPSSILHSMVKEMQAKFEKYWSDFSVVLACAAVFDPRFKLAGVKFCYIKLYGEDRANEMLLALKKTLFDLFDDYKETNEATYPRVGTSNVGNSEYWRDDCFADFEAYDASVNVRRSELEIYLDRADASFQRHLDVLEFWKNEEKTWGSYPVLSTMARDILTISYSLAPMESGFSMEENVVMPCRSFLSPKTLEALTCYGDWLRAKDSSSGPSNYILDAVLEKENKEDEEDDEEKMELELFYVGGPCSSACSKFNGNKDEM